MTIRTRIGLITGTLVLASACLGNEWGDGQNTSSGGSSSTGGTPSSEEGGSAGQSTGGMPDSSEGGASSGGTPDSGGTGGSSPVCPEAGVWQKCHCPDGQLRGFQQCSNDRKSWGACESCGDVATGGKTGTGGASATGGSVSSSGGSPSTPNGYAAITYVFNTKDAALWEGLSVYHDVRNANGVILTRTPPYAVDNPQPASLGTFTWAIVYDSPGPMCSSQNASTVQCTAHVPAGGTVRVNVHQHKAGLGIWACEAGSVLSGTLRVKDANGNAIGYSTEPSVPEGVTAPCTFRFTAPGAP